MKDIAALFDFLLDLVCMMPPLDATDMVAVPTVALESACLIAVAVLVFSILRHRAAELFGGNGILAMIAIAGIIAVSFLSMKPAEWTSILSVSYPAMVISLRGMEGMLIGTVLAPRLRPWHSVAFLASGIIVYLVLCELTIPALRITKGLWALFGAIMASQKWTRTLAGIQGSPFGNVFSGIAMFAVFLSTMLYVQSSRLDQVLFQWVFPLGLMLGVIAGKGKWGRQSHESVDS